MYGLEKGKKKFDFDLEVELKKKPQNKKKLEEKIRKNKEEIKTYLKQKSPKHIEEYGILLNAYDALGKVISKIK